MTIKNYWRLACLEEPREDGAYQVRLSRNGDLLAPPIEVIGEYECGTWIIKETLEFDGYYVNSWREN